MAASELALLDRESRNVAGWFLATPTPWRMKLLERYRPWDEYFWNFGGNWMLGPWLTPQEGSLKIVNARQGESLLVDLIAVGAVLQIFSDFPSVTMRSQGGSSQLLTVISPFINKYML